MNLRKNRRNEKIIKLVKEKVATFPSNRRKFIIEELYRKQITFLGCNYYELGAGALAGICLSLVILQLGTLLKFLELILFVSVAVSLCLRAARSRKEKYSTIILLSNETRGKFGDFIDRVGKMSDGEFARLVAETKRARVL